MICQKPLIAMAGIGALVAGFLLVPRQEERSAMLARDGLYGTASQELQSLLAAGDRRPRILMQLYAMHERQGDRAKARTTLDAYLTLRPDDPGAIARRAELSQQDGDTETYLAEMARLFALKPSREARANLLGLYRLHGRFEDERRLLEQQAVAGRLGHEELARLGALHAARGDPAVARRWLEAADAIAPANAVHLRFDLLDVLLEARAIGEAERRAGAWLRAWRDPYLAGRVIVRLAQEGEELRAATLARQTSAVMPEATFEVAGVVSDAGFVSISRAMLATWADLQTDPTAAQVRDFVYASKKADDDAGLLNRLASLLHKKHAPAFAVRLAEALGTADDLAVLAPLRRVLTHDLLQRRPLFAAELAFAEGNAGLAIRYLDTVDAARLDSGEQLRWLRLLQQIGLPPGAAQWSARSGRSPFDRGQL